MATLFTEVYDRFLGKTTDDMYMEYTLLDTCKDLQAMLLSALPGFEFPRKDLYDNVVSDLYINNQEVSYEDTSYFNQTLTSEEINILAILMLEIWVQRQLTSIENTRMKYTGTDFKMTSQANHLAKLQSLLNEIQRQSIHMQRLYKRRKTDDGGLIKSNWSCLREVSALDD